MRTASLVIFAIVISFSVGQIFPGSSWQGRLKFKLLLNPVPYINATMSPQEVLVAAARREDGRYIDLALDSEHDLDYNPALIAAASECQLFTVLGMHIHGARDYKGAFRVFLNDGVCGERSDPVIFTFGKPGDDPHTTPENYREVLYTCDERISLIYGHLLYWMGFHRPDFVPLSLDDIGYYPWENTITAAGTKPYYEGFDPNQVLVASTRRGDREATLWALRFGATDVDIPLRIAASYRDSWHLEQLLPYTTAPDLITELADILSKPSFRGEDDHLRCRDLVERRMMCPI